MKTVIKYIMFYQFIPIFLLFSLTISMSYAAPGGVVGNPCNHFNNCSKFKTNGQSNQGQCSNACENQASSGNYWAAIYEAAGNSALAALFKAKKVCELVEYATYWDCGLKATYAINPACGNSEGACNSGTPGNVTEVAGYYNWNCTGLNELEQETTVACSIEIPPTPVNGSCGSSNNQNLYSAPTTNLCSSGTASSSGAWTWTCSGSDGGSNEACSANKKQDAICGTPSSGRNAPNTGLCFLGGANPSTPVDNGSHQWAWGCQGINGGNSVNCTTDIVNDGVCEPTEDGQTLTSTPTILCSAGTANPNPPNGSGPWDWVCEGINGGSNDSCSANLIPIVNGACGDDDSATLNSTPTKLCNSGSESSISETTIAWSWTCSGSNGGTTDACLAYKVINGACGTSHNGNYDNPPTNNLCSSGISTTVTENSNNDGWVWSCESANGTPVDCVANKNMGGVCGSSDRNTSGYNGPFSHQSEVTDLCSIGTEGSSFHADGNTGWEWTCTEDNSTSCYADKGNPGVCGISDRDTSGYIGPFSDQSEVTDLCSVGTEGSSFVVDGSDGWEWTCTEDDTTSCYAEKISPGVCGSSHNVPTDVIPSSDLCGAGSTASTVTLGSDDWTWTWTCTDDTATTCSAEHIKGRKKWEQD
ncbi:MAG: hypothetical protein HQL46_10550 [Gammaproteobacteria bacterium]|nr:hypothetical protein [Gammaproteobacteria bacterium]